MSLSTIELSLNANPLRNVIVKIDAIGVECNIDDLRRIVTNENSGHPIAVAFRSAWAKKKLGRLVDWRLGALQVEEAIPFSADGAEVPSGDKPKIIVTVQDSEEPIRRTGPMAVAFPSPTSKLWAVSGCATLRAKPTNVTCRMGGTISVLWALVTGDADIDAAEGDDEAMRVRRLGIANDALKAGWNTGELGFYADWELSQTTWAVDKLAQGFHKVNSQPKPKPQFFM